MVLPQALRISLPAMTNEFIALFKNTTLVLIASIFDLGIPTAMANPAWVGMNMEAYVFAGAIYWFVSPLGSGAARARSGCRSLTAGERIPVAAASGAAISAGPLGTRLNAWANRDLPSIHPACRQVPR